MTDITDQAAELNRKTWDSFRRQRDARLAEHRGDSAEDILQGRGYLRQEYIQLVGDVSGKRLLDMGCGEAAETCEWARLGAHVVGVDNSPKQIEAGCRNAGKLGIECRLIVADLLRLPADLLKGEFDIAFSSWVTAWVGDPNKWFVDVYNALKPGGILVVGGGHPLGDFIREAGEGSEEMSYFSEGPHHIESSEKNAFNPEGEHIENIEWTHTLGTIVTAVAQSGMRITHLMELPPSEGEEIHPRGIPVGFILRAVKDRVE